jgi:hypothetical protein
VSALRRVALAVLSPVLLAGAGMAAPGPVVAQTLSGTLLSMDGDRPIVSGAVELLRAGDAEPVASAVSDQTGRFQVTAPEPGIYIVRGLAPFHHPMVDGPVELEADATLVVQFRLTPNPVELEPVEVEAEARDARLESVGFYDRERQGVGHFITREDIEARDPHSTLQLFDHVPGAYIARDRRGLMPNVYFTSARNWNALLPGGENCAPRVYLDGHLFGGGRTGITQFTLEWIAPHDIEAMEVYTRAARVPAQYQMDSQCGVILVWTRR